MDVIFSNYIFYNKNPCVSLTADFRGLIARLRTPSYTFWTFTVGVYELVRIFHLMACLTLLAITHHTFFHVMQPCDSVGYRPTVPSPPINHQVWCLIIIMHSHPFNAMSPCICNIMYHCMLYHATYIMNMDNSNHTIHNVLWTIIPKAYNFQIKLISMSIYILTLIYQHLITPKHIIQTQEMTTLIHKTNYGMDMPTKQSTQWPQGKP